MAPPSPLLLIPEDPNHDPRHADHPGYYDERHKQRETKHGFSNICASIPKVLVHGFAPSLILYVGRGHMSDPFRAWHLAGPFLVAYQAAQRSHRPRSRASCLVRCAGWLMAALKSIILSYCQGILDSSFFKSCPRR